MFDPTPSPSPTPETLAYWKDVAEFVKAVLESLAIVAGSLALIKWLRERYDRATDVLFELETKFQDPQIQQGCRILENESEYIKSAPILQMAVRVDANLWPDSPLSNSVKRPEEIGQLDKLIHFLLPQVSTTAESSPDTTLASLDKLLRFYVVMHGLRKARQVPDAALRTCYRYWLAHYFHPRRPAFRAYVNQFFPTLRKWLDCEKHWYRRSPSRPARFFRATDFWDTNPSCIYEQLRRAIEGRVLVIAGAGLSAESGLPTFRGKGGEWNHHKAEDLATKAAFTKDPARVWEFYNERRQAVLSHVPNEAHKALVTLATRVRSANDFLLITQNVDHYEFDAGLSLNNGVQIHGDILTTRCSDSLCSYRKRETNVDQNASKLVPTCPQCGKLLRPDVVWFDEEFRPGDKERVDAFLNSGPCDAVFVIGTSATFDYIADWALTAVDAKGWLIEINPHPSEISRFAHQVYRGKAGKELPKLMNKLIPPEPRKRLRLRYAFRRIE